MAQYPQLTEAADKIRNLFNDLWYYGDNAGLKMGYAPNGFLPRMYDMTKIVNNPNGFRAAAERVYNAEWRQMIADRYGAAPEISYFETPVVVDNTLGKTILDAAE